MQTFHFFVKNSEWNFELEKGWISRAKDLLLESDLTKKQIYLSGEDRDTMLFYITVVVDFTHSLGYSPLQAQFTIADYIFYLICVICG